MSLFHGHLVVLVTPAFAHVTQWLIQRAKSGGYPIVPDGDRHPKQCGINWMDHAIYINPKRPPDPDVVWDLLHEIGHIPCGVAPKGQTVEEKKAWERAAWQRGWDELTTAFPEMQAHEAAFWKHAEDAIKTYDDWKPN